MVMRVTWGKKLMTTRPNPVIISKLRSTNTNLKCPPRLIVTSNNNLLTSTLVRSYNYSARNYVPNSVSFNCYKNHSKLSTLSAGSRNFGFNTMSTLANSFNIESSQPLPNFDKTHLVPREETQVSSFLKKYSKCDGRNTLVAILDTGVDPGAAGLQITSDGKPKIVDIVDCTGSGDVIMDKKPATLQSEEKDKSYIMGLSGRKLKINPSWKNPSGEFHLGLKKLRELYPGPVTSRVTKTEGERQNNKNMALIETIRTKLAAKKDSGDKDKEVVSLKESKDELEAQEKVLLEFMKHFNSDDGPVLDVLVFHDGTNHRVAVDWSATGDMEDCKALADYTVEREYWPLNYEKPPYELLNISVKVYDDGKLISLVSSAGTHATHVAGILASHHPEEPQLDGVAPGAQIISLKIGESRLGSMETQIGLTRAIATMAQHRCDLANMSYGEESKLPNQGRFTRWLQDEIVRRYNCIFVSSAGNAGPALSTVGSPGGTSDEVIGVGAYVNHSMMKTDYSALSYSPEMAYSWSSRGPTTDGDMGVDIFAPGGAITSVPTYILHKSQLMNGTSMSSPNLCGCLALLVSALKQNDMTYTSYRVQRAIKNTAKPFPNRLNQDKASFAGIIQVEKSWDYLCSFKDQPDLDTRADVKIVNQNMNRGVYLREKEDSEAPFFANVQLGPKFLNDNSVVFGDKIYVNKYNLELYLSLTSTASFISTPEVVAYNNSGKAFTIKVDASSLEAGKVHYGEVQGWDSSCPSKGPIVQIPITVIKPITLTTPFYILPKFNVSPGSVMRRFIQVPNGATYCDVKVSTNSSSNSPVRLMLHLMQLVPQERYSTFEHKYVLSFNSDTSDNLSGPGNQQETRRFAVVEGRTLEICIVQFWANTGDQEFKTSFEFHGIQAAPYTNTNRNIPLLMDSSKTTHLFNLVAPLRREPKAQLNITLKTLQKVLTPSKAIIAPLRSIRDQLPPSDRRLYQLVIDYPLQITQLEAPTSLTLQYPPAMQKFLYDSFLDGFFVTILDAYGKPIGYDEVSPRDQKLPHRGEYTIRLELNHTDLTLLENIKSDMAPHISALIQLPKSKEISLGSYKHPHAPYSSEFGKASGPIALDKNSMVPVYVKSPALPSGIDAKAGDILLGTLSVEGTGPKLSSSDSLVTGFVLAPKPDLAESKTEETSDLKLSDNDKLALATLKTRLDLASKSSDKAWKITQFTEIFEGSDFSKSYENELQGKMALLEVLRSQMTSILNLSSIVSLEPFDEKYTSLLSKVVSKAFSETNGGAIRDYFAHPKPDPILQSLMKLRRETLSLAHLSNLIVNLMTKDSQDTSSEKWDNLYNAVVAHTDGLPSGHEYFYLLAQINYFQTRESYGKALKALNDHLATKFTYLAKDRSRYANLLSLQSTLVKKLEMDDVWGAFLANRQLKDLPEASRLVLG